MLLEPFERSLSPVVAAVWIPEKSTDTKLNSTLLGIDLLMTSVSSTYLHTFSVADGSCLFGWSPDRETESFQLNL